MVLQRSNPLNATSNGCIGTSSAWKRFDAAVETADNGARADAYERRVLAPLVPPTESGTWRSPGERNPGIARRPFESAGSVTANI